MSTKPRKLRMLSNIRAEATIIQPLAVKEPKNYTGLLYLLGVAMGLAVSLTLILPGRSSEPESPANEESRSIGEQLDKEKMQNLRICRSSWMP